MGLCAGEARPMQRDREGGCPRGLVHFLVMSIASIFLLPGYTARSPHTSGSQSDTLLLPDPSAPPASGPLSTAGVPGWRTVVPETGRGSRAPLKMEKLWVVGWMVVPHGGASLWIGYSFQDSIRPFKIKCQHV